MSLWMRIGLYIVRTVGVMHILCFKRKTAYGLRISDWSSDVCSSDLDFFSGAGTLNYGHNNPVLKQKLIEYLDTDGLVHGLDMATSAKKYFLETVDQVLLKPRSWQYTLQFTGPTGTNAVEAALKIARQVKCRKNIVSFTYGFHGVSGGSLS